MGVFGKIYESWRGWLKNLGYGCDCCGAELFDYPIHRLCASCEGKLVRPARTCPKCGRGSVAEGVCTECKSIPPKFTRGISLFEYKSDVAMLVNRMKNKNARMTSYFGECMAEETLKTLTQEELSAPLVVNVPMKPSKRVLRGYDQAEWLAESLTERLIALGVDAELNSKVLEKRRETGEQKHMSRKERRENVAGAYVVRDRKACKGRTVLLIDDVMTTGSTGSECAVKLLAAGAEKVYFITVAAVAEQK